MMEARHFNLICIKAEMRNFILLFIFTYYVFLFLLSYIKPI